MDYVEELASNLPQVQLGPNLVLSLSPFTVVQLFIFADIIFIVSHTCREQKKGRSVSR